MTKPDTPFPRHWLYYIVLKYAVIAAAVAARALRRSAVLAEVSHGPRTPLSVRHHAARRRADQRRRFHARRQAGDRRACSTSSASTMSRAAIRAPIRPTREFFAEPTASSNATFTAFGMTRRPGRSASNDPGLAALLEAKADAICFVAKTWDYHVRVALETTDEENLASIRDSVRAAKAKGREVLLDCEHFFDGYKANPTTRWPAPRRPTTKARAGWCCATPMAARCRTRSRRSSARWCKAIPGDHVGIHAHNDTEQAVANSLAAVRAGARQIQGTLNGLGERCGNANLVSIIPTLKLKPEFAERFEIGVSDAQLQEARARLARARRAAQPRAQPARALCRRERLRHQGRHPCLRDREGPGDLRARRAGDASATSARCWCRSRPATPTCWPSSSASASRSTRTIRASAACSRSSRSARPSATPTRRPTPRSSCWRGARSARCRIISTSSSSTSMSSSATTPWASASPSTMAVVKVKVGDENMISAAEGNGPVNALDLALRKDLGKYQNYIDGLKLTDYRVRILNAGTEAVTRVLIESEDETGDHWTTIGVSPNIIDASFQALMDSIIYKLVKSGRAGVTMIRRP